MKKNIFTISESERERILGMHLSATSRQYLSEAGPYEDDQIPGTTTQAGTTPPAPAAAPTTPAPAAAPTTATSTAPAPNEVKTLNDRDYEYKKDGERYFFKLKSNPASPKAKQFQSQKKYISWTEAKSGSASYNAIKGLDWSKAEASLSVNKANTLTPEPSTKSGVDSISGGGGSKPEIINPMADAKKTLPQIDKVDPVKAREVIAWSKTPAGQYVLKTPADKRESALDNLDRVRGDKTTRNLKKEIRMALGMSADSGVARLGQKIQGAVQGAKQGFKNTVPPAK